MKRREFLRESMGFVGALLPALAKSQVQPCPPPSLSLEGVSIATPCTNSTGTLAQVANGLSSGQWGTLVMNGLNSSWLDESASFLEYCPHGEWDANHRKFVFIGATHPGTPTRVTRQFDYTDSTNTWVRDNSVIPPGNGSDDHGYYHTAVDPATGDVYHKRYGGDAGVSKRAYGSSSWTTLNNPPNAFNYNVATALIWHPGLNSGIGGLVFGCENGIATWNPSNGQWTSRRSAPTMGAYHNAGVYNRVDQCAYVGCGNGSSNLWKVTAAGVVSQVAAPPISVGANIEGGQAAMFGSTGSNRMVIIAPTSGGKAIYEYNHTANSWANIGTYPFSYSQWYAGFTCDTYGCLVFIMTTSGNNIGSTAYVWKR